MTAMRTMDGGAIQVALRARLCVRLTVAGAARGKRMKLTIVPRPTVVSMRRATAHAHIGGSVRHGDDYVWDPDVNGTTRKPLRNRGTLPERRDDNPTCR